MTTLDLAELRRLATDASRGEWEAHLDDPRRVCVTRPDGDVVCEVHGLDWLADARYIAAATPDVVLTLLDRVERAEASVADHERRAEQCPACAHRSRLETELADTKARLARAEEALRYCRAEAQRHGKKPAAWAPAVTDRVDAYFGEGSYAKAAALSPTESEGGG